jgi:hypothetical protein
MQWMRMMTFFEMEVNRMGMLAVCLRKMKAQTVKMETVTLIGTVDRIWHPLCMKCMKLVVKYMFLADVLFLGVFLKYIKYIKIISSTLLWANITLWHMSFTFFKSVTMSDFLSIPTAFHEFLTRTALGDANVFLTHFYNKCQCSSRGTTSAMWFYHRCNQSKHMTDGVRVMTLSTSL